MEQKVIQGWDVYGHSYEYDEVKVIAMMHKALIERDWYPDWEDIMNVGHQIYQIYVYQLTNEEEKREPVECEWMEIWDTEEYAYIQAWFSRTCEDWLDYYGRKLKVKD